MAGMALREGRTRIKSKRPRTDQRGKGSEKPRVKAKSRELFMGIEELGFFKSFSVR